MTKKEKRNKNVSSEHFLFPLKKNNKSTHTSYLNPILHHKQKKRVLLLMARHTLENCSKKLNTSINIVMWFWNCYFCVKSSWKYTYQTVVQTDVIRNNSRNDKIVIEHCSFITCHRAQCSVQKTDLIPIYHHRHINIIYLFDQKCCVKSLNCSNFYSIEVFSTTGHTSLFTLEYCTICSGLCRPYSFLYFFHSFTLSFSLPLCLSSSVCVCVYIYRFVDRSYTLLAHKIDSFAKNSRLHKRKWGEHIKRMSSKNESMNHINTYKWEKVTLTILIIKIIK